MDIPAYTSPTLCLGRTFDLETSRACADVFPSMTDLPIKSIDSNKFSFKYQVVKSSKDVNDLLDVSGELSLKIKANLLKVEGAGQYINDSKLEEGTTNLLSSHVCWELSLVTVFPCLPLSSCILISVFLHTNEVSSSILISVALVQYKQ